MREIGIHVSDFYGQSAYERRMSAIRYTCDFPGADEGERVNNAVAALPAAGGKAIMPGNYYDFDTQINYRRRCITLAGQGPISGWQSFSGPTVLNWTGDPGTPPIVLGAGEGGFTGSNTLKKFRLNIPTGGTGLMLEDSPLGRMHKFYVFSGNEYGGLSHGTATGGTATTLVDNNEGVNFINDGVKVGMKVFITRGKGRGELKVITDVPNETTIEIAEGDEWDTTVDDTSVYIAGVTIGVDMVQGKAYGWGCSDCQYDYNGIGLNMQGAHGWKLSGNRWLGNVVGGRIYDSSGCTFSGGNCEKNQITGLWLLHGQALNVDRMYYEVGTSGKNPELASAIHLGSETVAPREVEIIGNRLVNGGQPTTRNIEIDSVIGAIIRNYNVLGATGYAIKNNAVWGTDDFDLTIDGNHCNSDSYQCDLIDDYTGVKKLHDLDKNIFMVSNLPTAAGSLPPGAFWRDAGDSNRLKVVPP